MSENTEKTTLVSGSDSSSEKDEKKKIQPGSKGRTVHLRFLDSASMRVLLPDDTSLDVQTSDGDKATTGKLARRKKASFYDFILPSIKALVPTQQPGVKPEALEGPPCSPPADDTLAANYVTLSTAEPIRANCRSWIFPPTTIGVPSDPKLVDPSVKPGSEPEPEDEYACDDEDEHRAEDENKRGDGNKGHGKTKKEPCTIGILLQAVDETYTATFRAYDTCIQDYSVNAKAFLNDANVKATPIVLPGSENTSSTQPRARTVSVKTVNGVATLPGLLPKQNYRFEVTAPDNYLCVLPPPAVYNNQGSQRTEFCVHFRPCCEYQARSVIFVHEECQGVRVEQMEFSASGIGTGLTLKGKNGIWDVPMSAAGTIEFKASGKVFSPPSITLDNNSPVSFVVTVAEQQVLMRHQKFYLLDDDGAPFVGRKVHIRWLNGEVTTTNTGDSGDFHAEHGSVAWADDDELGHKIDPVTLLISEIA